MRNSVAWILAMALLLVSATVVVWSQGAGVIEGHVLNATSANVPLEGVPVILWAIAADEQSILQQVTTDSEGEFRFPDLDMQASRYQVQATYQDVSYWSDALAFSADESLLSLPVTVFETTASEADLHVERAHVIVDTAPGTIQVQELHIIVNSGNQTYVGPAGEGGETLQFVLPIRAAEVQLPEALMACCIVETAEGFAYTQPILPGTKEFFFSYELDASSTSYTISRIIAYPVRHLDVFVADNGVEATGPGLAAEEAVSLQGQRYLHLTAEELPRGETLRLDLASLPSATRATVPERTISPVLARAVIGVGTLLVIAALTYPFFKKSQDFAS